MRRVILRKEYNMKKIFAIVCTVLFCGLIFTSFSPSLDGRAVVAAALPLSMVFGLYSGFWRNSSLAMECSLGLGYSLSDGVLLYGSSALLTYSYRMQGYSLALGIGNKHWVSEQVSFSSGLFMQLGLAYTW